MYVHLFHLSVRVMISLPSKPRAEAYRRLLEQSPDQVVKFSGVQLV